MEYLNVFYGIFREDMPSLSSGFLPRRKYQTYLSKYHPYLFTHFSLEIKKESNKEFSITKNHETPFYQYEQHWSKEGYKNASLRDINPSLLEFLLGATSIDENNIKEIFVKQVKGTYLLDVFLNRSYAALSNSELCYYYYHLKMLDAYKDFTEHLHQLYFDESTSEKQRESIIRKYQLKLQYYSATLETKHLTEIPQKASFYKSMQDVFCCIHSCIDRIILFMEECCFIYLDKELGISYELRLKFISKYYDQARTLIDTFKKQKLPQEIETELCKPLYKIKSNSFQPLTYVRREYYRNYIDLFTRLFTKYDSPEHNQIYHLAIALDLNTHIIGQALSEVLLDELEEFPNETERLSYLYLQLMRVEEIPVTASVSYHSEFPSLQKYLIGYIQKRIELSHQNQNIERQNVKKVSGSDVIGVLDLDPNLSKRKVYLTVSELSLFARLYSEVGVVKLQKREKQNYFKFLSKIYQSKDSDEISEQSVRNGFYNSSPDTYKKVQIHLIDMLDKLRKLKESKNLA